MAEIEKRLSELHAQAPNAPAGPSVSQTESRAPESSQK
jgi:hypothetical protein